MRVVAGIAKGRKLSSVPGSSTRPILDRVKTALFDILRPRTEGCRVLDLFAGSGGVGIEALSQGASECTFIDLEPKAVETIKANLKVCGLLTKSEVRLMDAFRYLRTTKKSFDLVYIAPPQYHGIWIQVMQHLAERPHILSANALVVAQIDPREYEELHLSALKESEKRRYGNTQLVFYEKV